MTTAKPKQLFFSIPPRVARWRAFPAAAMVMGAAGLSACVAPQRVVVRERIVEQVPATPQIRSMPAPVREDRGPAPGPAMNWVPGHWRWAGNDWAWAQGHWVSQAVAPMPPVIVEQITVAPSPRQFWVPGHWAWRPESGGWVWARGAWHG